MKSAQMRERASARSTRPLVRFTAIIGVMTLAGGLALGWARAHSRRPPSERYTITDVRRADLLPTLTASGRVQSSKRPSAEGELENGAVGVRGPRSDAGGGPAVVAL